MELPALSQAELSLHGRWTQAGVMITWQEGNIKSQNPEGSVSV